ncbi:hypothetical protein HPP92_022202 [Vanilla planifolia]|uniref:Trichome birefringence-like C-terminal domain-containing protein n=1 Tax=Vanilla planifolia TaxID=51239 RepID=A0A835PWW4_VANPL|nr:hypothetical protein HPP92_022202 [Vanilla planifolia]
MLERSRNKRILFVGDSIGRNQWESLVCMLWDASVNRTEVFEKNGSPISKHKGFLSIFYEEYNLTVEYYRAPFLVAIGRPPPNSPAGFRRPSASIPHIGTLASGSAGMSSSSMPDIGGIATRY